MAQVQTVHPDELPARPRRQRRPTGELVEFYGGADIDANVYWRRFLHNCEDVKELRWAGLRLLDTMDRHIKVKCGHCLAACLRRAPVSWEKPKRRRHRDTSTRRA